MVLDKDLREEDFRKGIYIVFVRVCMHAWGYAYVRGCVRTCV